MVSSNSGWRAGCAGAGGATTLTRACSSCAPASALTCCWSCVRSSATVGCLPAPRCGGVETR
eukprot:2523769-Pyramimonas_sp.AAC.1